MIGLLLTSPRIGVLTTGSRWLQFPAVGQDLDLCGDVLGVVFHPTEQRGAAGVLPVQAEKVESRILGHPPVVADASFSIQYRCVDPGVGGLVSGGPCDCVKAWTRCVDPGVGGLVSVGPYDCVNAELGAVSEAHGVVRRLDRSRMQFGTETSE